MSSSCNSIINIEDEAVDKLGDDDIQVWRKTRCKSVVGDRARLTSASPPRPGTAADMWSYGCLLAEVLTGRKLFQAGDKLASVLRPAQLLEMKLGDTEAVWAEQGCGDMFRLLKDLLLQCIKTDPRYNAGQMCRYVVCPILYLMLPPVQLEAECGGRPVPPRVPEQPRARGAGPAAAPLAAPPVRAADHQPRPRRRAARPAAAVRGVRRDQRVPRGGQRARGGALRLRGVAHLLTRTEQTHCSILITDLHSGSVIWLLSSPQHILQPHAALQQRHLKHIVHFKIFETSRNDANPLFGSYLLSISNETINDT